MSTTASLDAYDAIVTKLPAKRRAMFKAIHERSYWHLNSPGLTIRESMDVMGWSHPTASARIFELAEAGLVKDSGKRRLGQTAWVEADENERETLRAARKAARKYETEIDHWTDHPMREEQVLVTFAVPRTVWTKLKRPVRVRFL